MGVPRYPSLPRLSKLANNGRALNRLEFSILTYKGLGTRLWSTCPSPNGEVSDVVLVDEDR